MKTVLEMVMAFLCVIGIATILWVVLGWTVRPVFRSPVVVILPAKGDGGQLEAQLMGLFWLRAMGIMQGETILYDEGLTKEGQEVALHLALRWQWVSCCPSGMLEEWVTHRDT